MKIESADTLNSTTALSPQAPPCRLIRILVATAVLCFSTFLTSADWNASRNALDASDAYHKRDNATADRRSGTNLYSAIGFFSLAGFGIAALLLPDERERRKWNAFLLLLAAYWLWAGMSTLWSPDVFVSMKKYLILLLLIVSSFGITKLLNREELIWFVVLTSTVLIVVGLFAELSLGTFRPNRSTYRFSGLVHTNSQSFFGAMLCISAFCITPKNSQWKVISWIFIGIGVGCIVLTKSRTSMVGLLATALIVSILATRGYRRWVLLTGMGFSASIAFLALALLSGAASRGVFGVAAMGRGENTESLTGRVPLWQELFLAIKARPFGGYGFGSFWNSKRVTYYSEMFYWEIPSGHSMYIDSVLELGAIGGFLFLSILVVGLLIALLRYYAIPAHNALFPISLIVFAFVHGFTESQFAQTGYGGFWLMINLITLAATSVRDKQQTVPPKQQTVPPTYC
jgi:exopolysaccharide production protein ExoQ